MSRDDLEGIGGILIIWGVVGIAFLGVTIAEDRFGTRTAYGFAAGALLLLGIGLVTLASRREP